MQKGEDDRYLKVSSCCKHYAAYSVENWGGYSRTRFNALVTERDMADTYLPAFQSCVERGQASALMCSYNAINGIPSCANIQLMTNYARQDWGFDGYITSDCGAFGLIQSGHNFTQSDAETALVALSAGMDIGCDNLTPGYIREALVNGFLLQKTVDAALIRLFNVQMRLGMFDPRADQVYTKYNYTNRINTPAHQQLALEAARQGIVLLKNTNNVLPISASLVKSIAVIGPNGNATEVLKGNYAGKPAFLISPIQGLESYVSNVLYAKGCDIASNSTTGFEAAVALAQKADVTVLVVGLDQSQESEDHDRTITDLPGVQNDLIKTVATQAKGPVIVVVMTGGAVDLTVPKSLSQVGAILWCGYPGQAGGQALADVIFGVFNPSGRLPYTIHDADFPSQVSMIDMNMRPSNNPSTPNPGRTYRFFTGKPVYNFGEGLSYTTFTYTNASVNGVSSTKNGAAASLPLAKVHAYTSNLPRSSLLAPHLSSQSVLAQVSTVVTNTGSRSGTVSVLAFAVPPDAGTNGLPLKSLFGFQKVELAPGESKTLQFAVTAHDLSCVNESGERTALGGPWRFLLGDSAPILLNLQ